MKTIQRFLAVFLLAALLAVSFAACESPTTPGVSTDDTTAPETLPPAPTSLKLIENGQTLFRVVLPSNATSVERTRIEKFVSSFKSKTGVEFALVDESASAYENADYEVLIGDVDRKESQDTLAQLRSSEYFYGIVGNKLVITGKDEYALDDSIQFFLRKVVDAAASVDKANMTLEASNNYFYKYSYPIDNLTIGNTPIYNYSVVYSKDGSNAVKVVAEKLIKLIYSFTGYELPLVGDTKDPTGHEIIIGNTDRTSPSDPSNGAFSVVCANDNLYLKASHTIGYDFLYTYIQRKLSNTLTDTLTFENGFTYEESFASSLLGGTENMLNKGGSVRVMFHNVLIHDRPTAPTTWRAKYALDVYRDYAPDVIGLQEMQGSVRTAISSGLRKIGYKEVDYTETNSNFSFYEDPVFYNPETLKLINSGAYRLNETHDTNKSIGWALFEEKATGKQFLVASTHYTWLEDDSLANDLRIQNAQTTVQLLQQLANRYNVPIILGGDFNSRVGNYPITVLTQSGFNDVENLAEKTENSNTHHQEPVFDTETKLCKDYFAPVGGYESAIDHIFSYNGNNVTFNTYDVVTDPFALASSDHCPTLVDFTLK